MSSGCPALNETITAGDVTPAPSPELPTDGQSGSAIANPLARCFMRIRRTVKLLE